MKTQNQLFNRLLDQLSGTHPNDERTSHINEQGFALCGLFYICALAVQSVRFLSDGSFYTNGHFDPAAVSPVVLAVMILIMLRITCVQRRKESHLQQKTHGKIRLYELPRAAAALLSGQCPEDERTTLAFERGFAVCGLIGIAYFGFCMLFVIWCRFFFSTLVLLCAAPVLIGYVKLRENILTPPRFAHIRLSTKHLLLRLPVYLIAVLPYLILSNYALSLFAAVGGPAGDRIYSESLFIMFFQVLGDGLKDWIRNPWIASNDIFYYAAMIYLGVMIVLEFTVFFYQKQMKKMDAEENDLS
ncbi:MAG TPA: hypothetical protein DCG49_07270 [Ruminococcus sp.]|nr:hypothetical protein [Ruminococcus sp.]